jgi:Tol biopolymer transport system component
MNTFDRSSRFEQELPEILAAIAAPRLPDYTDDLLAQAAATRQRPRWTFPERWLPMGAIARRSAFFPTVPWRPLLVAALLLVLVAAALLIAGAQRRVPPPFGPARNGAIVFDDHGDIAGRDSLSGVSRTLVGGPGDDFAAGFTRDGSHLVFLRRTAGSSGSTNEKIQTYIAEADGTNPRPLSGDLVAPDWFDWSPDDQQLVMHAGGSQFGEHLYVIDLKSGHGPQKLTLSRPMTATFPNFLGPTGAEVVFRGVASTEDGIQSGIFAVRPDGSGLRPVSPTDGDRDNGYLWPQPSPDGRYIAYTAWDQGAGQLRIHLFELATGQDRTILSEESQGWATFSPDSRQIIFHRFSGDTQQVVVQSVDGAAPAIPMGPPYTGNDDVSGTYSPDGRSVVVKSTGRKESRLIDAATGGDGVVLEWAADGFTGWQRLAP